MVSTKHKGWRARRKATEELISKGFEVAVVERTGRFIKDKDCFGLFDLCAISPQVCAFIQITCNKPHSHKKYKEFSKKYSFHNITIEQWVWMDRKGFKKFTYYNGLRFEEL